MRSFVRYFLAATALSLCSQRVEAKIRVVTTTPDLAAIAQAVGGSRVEVQSIAKGYQDPHYVAAKPSYMRTLNRADLLLYTGLELEVAWLPLLIQGARNPKVVLGADGHLDASEGVPVLEVPTGQVDRSMGDIHPEGNPHYMLNPRNGLIVAETITERLEALFPRDAELFRGNLVTFREFLTRKIEAWEARIAGLRGRQIVTYHTQWEYLADWLGLAIAEHVEDKPGIPPSPRHIASLVERMKSDSIEILVCSATADVKRATKVAERTGARLVVLPISVGGEPTIETYADLFDTIVSRLEGASAAD
ncbi:MAG: metal ABC transporter substrate-binding protein [Candidatus Latescibacteria bacterium]|nr:metal ABC transporter substrate-binding protein [Candidatus Latescibacterota bacterium]